jgi:hypothetical protein
MLDPTDNGKDTIREWKNGAGPSGPVSTLVDLILEGVQHTDPDVSGFFIKYVRERPRDIRSSPAPPAPRTVMPITASSVAQR